MLYILTHITSRKNDNQRQGLSVELMSRLLNGHGDVCGFNHKTQYCLVWLSKTDVFAAKFDFDSIYIS